MAFGQANGYPATRNQMEQLTELILGAGHTDFRDARGPLGLTQRQAGGKFTRTEAEEMITRLQAEADDAERPQHPAGRSATVAAAHRRGQQATGLERIPSETLAAELQRRGWIVAEP
jgi:hypothetical protein